eukprot:gnl/TRDRNA2_/TRDRNA2_195878_c0_seq1.p1 gnl/TRDRNA2_/TRDRNA2_195878_c0~~gnl/TRDRNA2_/TRDRNA2_195878_c0_seq1.p1  ORF type:complete len:355 (-),score=57.80 gnl/TRDRNA2_/TRDRNA2_195878_c0_seq1:81-1145(-)
MHELEKELDDDDNSVLSDVAQDCIGNVAGTRSGSSADTLELPSDDDLSEPDLVAPPDGELSDKELGEYRRFSNAETCATEQAAGMPRDECELEVDDGPAHTVPQIRSAWEAPSPADASTPSTGEPHVQASSRRDSASSPPLETSPPETTCGFEGDDERMPRSLAAPSLGRLSAAPLTSMSVQRNLPVAPVPAPRRGHKSRKQKQRLRLQPMELEGCPVLKNATEDEASGSPDVALLDLPRVRRAPRCAPAQPLPLHAPGQAVVPPLSSRSHGDAVNLWGTPRGRQQAPLQHASGATVASEFRARRAPKHDGAELPSLPRDTQLPPLTSEARCSVPGRTASEAIRPPHRKSLMLC